jgi:glutaredoxin
MSDIIYSQNHCSACEKLKAEYRSKNIPFTEIRIGVDITIDQFKERYPDVRSVPFIVLQEL